MNLSETWQTWLKVTTSPNEATFDAERQKPNATLAMALIWMVIYAVIATVIGFVASLVFVGAVQSALPQILAQADLPPETKAQVEQIMNSGLFVGVGAAKFSAILTIPLFFLLITGVYHLIAKLLGGAGSFGRFAYLNAAFSAPLGILSSLIIVVPFVSCVAILIPFYEIFLTYLAVKTEHQLTSGKALITVLLPIFAMLAAGCCLLFGVIGLLASIRSN